MKRCTPISYCKKWDGSHFEHKKVHLFVGRKKVQHISIPAEKVQPHFLFQKGDGSHLEPEMWHLSVRRKRFYPISKYKKRDGSHCEHRESHLEVGSNGSRQFCSNMASKLEPDRAQTTSNRAWSAKFKQQASQQDSTCQTFALRCRQIGATDICIEM